jgi:chromosome segregation ATPase
MMSEEEGTSLEDRLADLDALENRIDDLGSVADQIEDLDALAERLGDLDGLEERIKDLDGLEERLGDLEATVEADIQDVRERVIQVKRETDGKAPADHDHDSLESAIADLEAGLEEATEAIDRTDSRLDGGFENFEEILERLLDRTSDLERDVNTIGRALRSMRQTLDSVAERDQQRARADHLKQTAAVRGVRTAKCEACNSKLDVALLSEARCPSCGESFHTLDANPGFFGTSILETGDRPALEGEGATARPDLEGLGGRAGRPTESESPVDLSESTEDGGE